MSNGFWLAIQVSSEKIGICAPRACYTSQKQSISTNQSKTAPSNVGASILILRVTSSYLNLWTFKSLFPLLWSFPTRSIVMCFYDADMFFNRVHSLSKGSHLLNWFSKFIFYFVRSRAAIYYYEGACSKLGQICNQSNKWIQCKSHTPLKLNVYTKWLEMKDIQRCWWWWMCCQIRSEIKGDQL